MKKRLLAGLLAFLLPADLCAQVVRGVNGVSSVPGASAASVVGTVSLPQASLGLTSSPLLAPSIGSLAVPAPAALVPAVAAPAAPAVAAARAVPLALPPAVLPAPSAPERPDEDPKPAARPAESAEAQSSRASRLFDEAAEAARSPVAALWSTYQRSRRVAAYRAVLRNPNAPVARREAAARLLGRLEKADAVAVLEAAATSESSESVRDAARAAIDRIARKDTAGVIREAKFMPLTSRRMAAVTALARLVADKPVNAAIDALAHAAVHDFSTDVRLAAIRGLAGARSQAAIVALDWLSVHVRAPATERAIKAALAVALAREGLIGHPHRSDPLAHVPPRFATGAIRAAIVYGVAVAVAELTAGVLTGTLSLKADSLNLFGNRTLDGIALFSLWLARRTPTARWTYGWLKSEALLALIASIGIAGIAFSMVPGAVSLLLHPEPAHGWAVVVFAALSVSSNLLSAFVLRPHRGVNAGLKGAYHTSRADALGTFGLVLAMCASLLAGIHVFMPLATMVLIGMILHVAWNIFWPAARTLLDSAPAWVDPEELRADLLAVPGVAAVFQMHLRALNSVAAELSVKLYHAPGEDPAKILLAAKKVLSAKRDRYKIAQSTIQIEPLPAESR